ncbi:MAG TPA: hypothetical protein VGM87_15350 [Roseomonas sp.]|jgi:hypothetical protein
MSGMFFDPELLTLWDAQALAPELAKRATAAPPEPLPLPPVPPAEPPPLPGQPAAGAPPGARPEPLAAAETRGLLTRLGLAGGGFKDRPPVDVPALLRGLAGMLRPPAAAMPRPVAQPAPPGNRPRGGSLPMRQATPGNPYLQAAAQPASPLRRRQRGLLDQA